MIRALIRSAEIISLPVVAISEYLADKVWSERLITLSAVLCIEPALACAARVLSRYSSKALR
ncbi:hypothetical protein D9M69_570400 [compost metagenome]